MKKNSTLSSMILSWSSPTLILLMAIGFTSCKKDDVTLKPAPTITVTPTTAANLAGTKVSTSVQIDSPEGGQTLNILVNGAANTALPNITLDGSTSQIVAVDFTIPANSVVGSNFIITFQATDKKGQQSGVGIFAATVSAVAAKVVVTKSGNITASETWTADKIYLLDGFVRVGDDHKPTSPTTLEAPGLQVQNVTLTIEPGTVIYGKPAAGAPGGTLIVQRGNKIIANGTAAKPIIFTSQKAPGFKKAGDWGGVVLCGKGNNNIISPLSASTGVARIEELEGGYGGFHGGGANVNDADNSGSLKYVRIEYAGYPINPNQEINGLTFGSVGSGTTISYIQVAYSNDDSYEWFGGTVNCDHLIAYKGIDDDFDTDNGFSGNVQFGLGIRDAQIADQSGSNGFECDNDANGSANAPFTSAKFSNMTIIGGKATAGTAINVQFQNAAQIRRNAEQDIYNSFFTAYPNGIYLDGQLPANNPVDGAGGVVAKVQSASGKVEFKNNILAGVDGWGGNGFGRVASAAEIANVTAPTGGTYPYAPNNEYSGAGSSTVPPRGRAVFAGSGAFASGVFGLNTAASGQPAIVEQTIDGVPAIQWFKTNNEILASWKDSGINANIFEPLNGAPTLVASGKLLTGASFANLPSGGVSPAAGFVTVGYRGAFGSTDWTTDGGVWVNWSPQVTDYSK